MGALHRKSSLYGKLWVRNMEVSADISRSYCGYIMEGSGKKNRFNSYLQNHLLQRIIYLINFYIH